MKDYYAILGIVPSAEDVVIRAAWKALAQRYHPDRFTGDVAKGNARMAEINEAYSVLSDPVRRKAYDKSRVGKEGDFGDWMHEEEADQAAKSLDPFEKDWALAVGFYPDLVEINNRLSKISQLLAFSYRASLLERKTFEKREKLAEVAEESFLHLYFGSNPEIVSFAKELIFGGNKAAAKALNDYIRVLGSNISPYKVIDKICNEFNIETKEMKQRRWRESLEEKKHAENVSVAASPNKTGNSVWLSVGVGFLILLTTILWARLPSQPTTVATPTPGPIAALTTGPVSAPSIFRDCSSCPEMAIIPPGDFYMGSNRGSNEKPVHRVTISRAFAMGKTEVTQGQWEAVMGNNPSIFAICGNNCPVENVSWDDIQVFIQKLSAMTGKQYRLPTEAEWEYACYGGSRTEYCGGDNVDDVAWYDENSGKTTHPVGQKQANAFGLFDMSGNVWEWVEDGEHNNYNGAPNDGSAWSGDGVNGVIRGTAWKTHKNGARTTFRLSFGIRRTAEGDSSFGFRVARALP